MNAIKSPVTVFNPVARELLVSGFVKKNCTTTNKNVGKNTCRVACFVTGYLVDVLLPIYIKANVSFVVVNKSNDKQTEK